MNTLLEKLETVLKSELEVHGAFLASTRELNNALKEENLVKIDHQRHMQDESICRIEKLEEQRSEYCTELARSLGISRRPVKMTMLLEKLPQQWRDRLGSIHMMLRDRLTELSRISVSNRILLEEGMRIAGNTISLIRNAGKKYGAYGHYGQQVAVPLTTTLFNKTV
jgi:hypothetical protein